MQRGEAAALAAAGLLLAAWYAWIAMRGSIDPFHVHPHGRTFNSMLLHLLVGRFDVDSGAVGMEGFERDGRVYAYWGIFCALLRAPLLLVPGAIRLDVTSASMLAAVWLAAMAKLWLALDLRRALPASGTMDAAVVLFALYAALGGATIGQLQPSIFQEVVFWAFAQASIFVCLAVRGVLDGQFSRGRLAAMALCAGFALITRVSTAIGLYGALGLLLLVLAAQMWRAGRFRLADYGVPLAILFAFVGIAALVNYARWGNIATFADYSFYRYNAVAPDRVGRMHAYGLFNLLRLPFGAQYFFFPLWAFKGSDGGAFFAETRARLIDVAEFPPASLLLTDPLPFILAGCLVVAWGRPRVGLRAQARLLALAAGLLAPWLLMMTAIYMAYRYRVEFYPLLDLVAALGVIAVGRVPAMRALFARHVIWIAGVTLAGVALAHLWVAIYQLTPFGPPDAFINYGTIDAYRTLLSRRFGL